MKRLLTRADHYLNLFSRYSLIALSLILTFMMASAAFMRYVLDVSFPAIEELSILVGLWFYFIAMIVVTRERGHLTGGILELLNLSHKTRMLIKGMNDFIGLCVLLFFGFYTFKYLFFMMKINRVSTNLGWPTAIWISAAAVGFSLMSLYKVRDLFTRKNSYTVYDNKSPHARDAVMEETTS